MFKEFFKFLKEYKIVSLAVAFIMGEASFSLISSLVKDVLLPIAAPLLSIETFENAAIHIGPVSIAYGTFLADIINLAILAFLIFIIARKLLKMEKSENK